MKNLRRISTFTDKWKKDKRVRLEIALVAAILSALVQVCALQVLVRSVGITSGGFIGIAMLIEHLGGLWGPTIPIQIAMLLMNAPVAFMCCKRISVRFTVFSLAQVLSNSVFLQIFSSTPILTDEVLNAIFGGVISRSAIVTALRGNASSGGTDFIALFVSNHAGQPIQSYVFSGNATMYCSYGSIFGWKYAGYSTIFQFISIGMIPVLHHKYRLVTLQVTTIKGPEVVEVYINHFRHDMSCMKAMDGYSKKKIYLLGTVISAYEVNDTIHVMQEVDEHMIINVLKTQQFVGRFYRAPLGQRYRTCHGPAQPRPQISLMI